LDVTVTDTDEASQEVRILSEADRPAVKKRRVYYLDNLRVVAVLAVLVLHTSMCYMVGAPPFWYVVDPDVNLVFTVIVLVLDVPIMSAMFLVAGYFALPSLRRRGLGGFVREKLTRLGVPWVFGVVVLAPAVTYLSYVSRGIQTPYLQFWANDFWGPLYQQAVYWFLGVLLALFLLLAVALKVKPGLLQRPAIGGAAPWRAVLAVFAVAVVAAAALSPFYGVGDWQSVGWVFMIQPARVALYAAFFVLGIQLIGRTDRAHRGMSVMADGAQGTRGLRHLLSDGLPDGAAVCGHRHRIRLDLTSFRCLSPLASPMS
jgi:surface polysaccharide O-acyltransferase-like enzyme